MTDEVDFAEEFDDEELNLAVEQVPTYQRRTASGQVITVKGYVRTDNSAVADRAKHSPGRPGVAASSGRFAGDRALPVWPDAGKSKTGQVDATTPEYEGMVDSGVVDQEALDKEVPVALEILPNLPQNPSMRKLISILKGLSTAKLSVDNTFDPDVIELARSIVQISGYSYVSKKTGKVVRVNPYKQLRSLINGMGGPQMAAKKGITPDLLDKAMPGFQIKDKLFKAKETKKSLTSTARKVRPSQDRKNLEKVNQLPLDRVIDIPAPKPGDNAFRKAMSAQHPLETVRSSREGSIVKRGNETWARGLDGLWYKTPRRNNKGIDDKELTKRLVSKAGTIELKQGDPVKRKTFPQSKVDFEGLNPNSVNFSDAVRYSKSLEPSFANLPEGVADSINGHLDVRKKATQDKSFAGMTKITSTKANNFYPKLTVHPNPEFEADLMSALPKQQKEGYSVPSTLHPLETMMARETANFSAKLMETRAPAEMVDRMYDRFSAAYDKNVKSDDGDYTGLSGKAGWLARITGERSQDLKSEIYANLSIAGARSPEEFIAESWTEFVANPSPRPIARDMGQAFQSSLEEFSDYLFKNKWVDATEIPERVYSKNRPQSVGHKVREAVDGEEVVSETVNTAPRSLRSVLTQESTYLSVSDEWGNPSFDAEVVREGSQATIGSLSYPLVDAENMPDGLPNDYLEHAMKGHTARYYEDPIEQLFDGSQTQKRYSDYINQDTALQAIGAIEETLASEGVTRFDANPRGGEDSIIYARAGYNFDPVATDVQEVAMMLNDLEDFLDAAQSDMKEGFYVVPKNKFRSMRTQLGKWQRGITAAPETWPTPLQIANFGKKGDTERSPGEHVLDRYSWSATKEVAPPTPKKVPTPPQPLPPKDVTPKKDAPWQAKVVTASALNSAARVLSKGVENDPKKLQPLLDGIVQRHQDIFPGSTGSFTGTAGAHTLKVTAADGSNIFSVDVLKNQDGSVTWSNTQTIPTKAGATLAADFTDHWEWSYQLAGLTGLRHEVRDEDPVAGYALAMQGYDWEGVPDREAMRENLGEAIRAQVADSTEVIQAATAAKFMNSPTEELVAAQQKAEEVMAGIQRSLESQLNALLEKFDDDPKGPTPFEIAQLGKEEAYIVNRLRMNAPSTSGPDSTFYTRIEETDDRRPSLGGGGSGDIPFLPTGGGGGGAPSEDPSDRAAAKALERAQREQGTILQQMTSLDGDALHDSFIEFAGKQFLSMGAYEMMKTAEGYYKWATDSYKPTARKFAVSFLFMLLRLMPASVGRGALMTLAGTITSKMKSPNPEDWPSKGEIDSLINRVKEKIPDEKLKGLEES